MFTMLSTQISYNTIFMHSADFKSGYKPYIIFEMYHVKYTNFSSIVNLATFSFHCAVKSHVYHVKYTDLI